MFAMPIAAVIALAGTASRGSEPWTVSSDEAENVAHYSPPILANGDIGMLVDYRNCQFQDIPSLKSIHSAWDEYRPETCRQGRRSSLTRLATFGHVEEVVTEDGSIAVFGNLSSTQGNISLTAGDPQAVTRV